MGNHCQKKFTPDQVLEIRGEYVADETLTVTELGRRHGVSQSTMRAAISGISYPDVPGATPIRPYRGGRPREFPEALVERVRSLITAGVTSYRIAQMEGISRSQVHYIKNRSHDYLK